jgi:hypothetical protein
MRTWGGGLSSPPPECKRQNKKLCVSIFNVYSFYFILLRYENGLEYSRLIVVEKIIFFRYILIIANILELVCATCKVINTQAADHHCINVDYIFGAYTVIKSITVYAIFLFFCFLYLRVVFRK